LVRTSSSFVWSCGPAFWCVCWFARERVASAGYRPWVAEGQSRGNRGAAEGQRGVRGDTTDKCVVSWCFYPAPRLVVSKSCRPTEASSLYKFSIYRDSALRVPQTVLDRRWPAGVGCAYKLRATPKHIVHILPQFVL
jgi:hypothetical protein